jgi:glycosyltransferase involved in cell wall biosynthesis
MDASIVSIVIPAFNEEKAIGPVVDALHSKFPEAELIVVDDGSTDGTAEYATSSGAKVIKHEFQRGYGASLRTGTEAATREHVLFCDGDGQHSAEDVEKLIAACGDHDLIIGVRGSDSHQSLLRRPGKFLLRLVVNFLAGTKIPDFNSGLRIFRRDVLKRYLHLMPNGFSFSTTSTFAILKGNRRISYVPITVQKRVGKSTVSQLKHGPQTIMLVLRLAVLFEPLKVFLWVAGVLLLLSLVSFAIDLANKSGIADTTVILSIATIIIFMFGLLCDQVSAIRREKHE